MRELCASDEWVQVFRGTCAFFCEANVCVWEFCMSLSFCQCKISMSVHMLTFKNANAHHCSCRSRLRSQEIQASSATYCTSVYCHAWNRSPTHLSVQETHAIQEHTHTLNSDWLSCMQSKFVCGAESHGFASLI